MRSKERYEEFCKLFERKRYGFLILKGIQEDYNRSTIARTLNRDYRIVKIFTDSLLRNKIILPDKKSRDKYRINEKERKNIFMYEMINYQSPFSFKALRDDEAKSKLRSEINIMQRTKADLAFYEDSLGQIKREEC